MINLKRTTCTMKTEKTQYRPLALLLLLLVTVAATISPLQAQQLAVKGETVYTMDGDPITNGVVLVEDGTITEVGPASRVTIPSGYEVHEAKVVTPGLIDAHSVVGLAGIYNVDADQDQLETSSPIQPELRAIDAYNPREKLVQFIREMGVTTLHTGHGPGALISGQTMIVKTVGETVDEALVDSVAMLAMTLGPAVSSNFKKPGTRAKGVAMLREQLIKAREYRKKMSNEDPAKHPPRDLAMEMLAKVLDGEVPALITAQKSTEIATALRLQREFGFNLVLDGGAEAYLVLDELKASSVSVLIHPTMVRNYGGTKNATMETAAKLQEMGIPFAFQSGFEGYVPKTRIVIFEAAIAASSGLNRLDALRSVTIESAEILGIADRVGSLTMGKDADIVLFDGDPLEYTTHVQKVIINGNVVSKVSR